MKDRIGARDVEDLSIGKDLLNLGLEIFPFIVTPEIVNHQEAAIEQVFPEDGHLEFLELEGARFDDVNKRIAK
jgi:hypothetical protein